MFHPSGLLRSLVAVCLVTSLGACSLLKSSFPDKRVEYQKAESLPTLEIPPDLATPATDEEMVIPGAGGRRATPTRYSDYAVTPAAERPGVGVLPPQEDLKVMREGDKRWLVVRGDADQVWRKTRDFWLDQGFLLKLEDPKAGVMETDWLENRANIPQDGIRALLSKVMDGLYDSSTRDRFRTRLERGETTGTTEVYVSHMGAQEVAQGDSTAWQPRANDPELEAVLLTRLMVFMGVQEKKAQSMIAQRETRSDRSRLAQEGGVSRLVLNEDFPRAWRYTGLALDRVGFTVEDRDRSRGVYFVRYNDPLKEDKGKKGFLSKLAFWRSDAPVSPEQFQIRLESRGGVTVVAVVNKDGVTDGSATAQRILTLLQEQLR